MLFVPPILDLDGQCGTWTRDRLEAMDAQFVAVVTAAFQEGSESRAAASATGRLKSSLNGKGAAIECALEAAWNLLCSKEGEISFPEIVAFVREKYPVDLGLIRAGFEQRFRQRGVGW